jgi:hypothetical protein
VVVAAGATLSGTADVQIRVDSLRLDPRGIGMSPRGYLRGHHDDDLLAQQDEHIA